MTVAEMPADRRWYGRQIAGKLLLTKRSPTASAMLRPVSRQSELEAALAAGEVPLITGPGLFVVGGDAVVHAVAGIIDASAHAEVFASGRAAVRARGHARIWIEGEVRADAYDSATVVATGRCRVRAADRARVWAEDGVAVTCEGDLVSVRR